MTCAEFWRKTLYVKFTDLNKRDRLGLAGHMRSCPPCLARSTTIASGVMASKTPEEIAKMQKEANELATKDTQAVPEPSDN